MAVPIDLSKLDKIECFLEIKEAHRRDVLPAIEHNICKRFRQPGTNSIIEEVQDMTTMTDPAGSSR